MQKLEPLKFNAKTLQMFASDPEPNNESDTVSVEDLKSQLESYKAEIEKQKKEKDKYSKELSEIKKAQKEKLTEEEKNQLAMNDLQEQLKQAQLEINSTKMSKELIKVGFEEKVIEELVKSANEEDKIVFVSKISKAVIDLVENVKKVEKENFLKSTPLPNGGKSSGNEVDPIMKNILGKNSKSNNARDYILGIERNN